MCHLDPRKRSCVHVWDPGKLHVSVSENAPTIVSWLLPAFKGLNETHSQPDSMSYMHAKVHIRKHWLAYFLYTETVIRMHVLHEDEICFSSMDAIFKHS